MKNDNSEIISSLLSRAISNFNSGDFKNAIQDFKKIIKINPKLSIPYLNIGTCRSNLFRRF